MKRISTFLILFVLSVLGLYIQEDSLKSSSLLETNPQTTIESYPVTKVVDGDTIDIILDNETTRVRLLGINTPESVDPRRPVECFGKEAKLYLENLIAEKNIRLESDPSQSNIDQYGRLLRYIYLEDTNINLNLIENGYATEYTYDQSYKYQTQFKQAQISAQQNQLGLWNPSTCDGNFMTNVPTPTPLPEIPNPDCPIKGNISGQEKIYHLPHCRDYNKVSISQSKGEQYFCNESQAIQANFRKAKNC